jgi:VanZ family protein
LTRANDQDRVGAHYAFIVAGIAVAILCGSFYPFNFYSHHDPRGPAGILLESSFRYARRGDVVANVLLYLPFGFFAICAFRRRTWATVAAAVSAGFILSLFVELFQFYDRGRIQDLSDICSNTAGTLLGALVGIAVRRWNLSPYLTLLLACWIGSRCYPAFLPIPTEFSISTLDLFRFFVAGLTIGLVTEALWGESRSRVALPAILVASLLVRSLVANVELAEIIGGALAVLAWCGLLWRLPARASIAAMLSVALIVLLALAPFHFSLPARDFGWLPFRSFLEDGTDHAIRVFFEKAFFYGSMIWLLTRAGLSSGAATIFGAVLVFCLRLTQVYLPGRSAEITDMVLLLILTGIMKLVSLAPL